MSVRIANPKLAIALHLLLLNWKVIYIPLSVSEVGLKLGWNLVLNFKGCSQDIDDS